MAHQTQASNLSIVPLALKNEWQARVCRVSFKLGMASLARPGGSGADTIAEMCRYLDSIEPAGAIFPSELLSMSMDVHQNLAGPVDIEII